MTAKHKGGLVVILGFGFIISLPLLLSSSPEEKQHLVQSTTQMRVMEKQTGLLNILPTERFEISSALKQVIPNTAINNKQRTWIDHALPEILKFGPNEAEARSIAKWAWVYGNSHDVEPALILALITIESRFDPFATSSVGAQGLMQVMPFWKKELGSPKDNLFDAATNIRYGTAILKHYIKRYHTVEKALAAYNGSKGRVKYPNKVLSQVKHYRL